MKKQLIGAVALLLLSSGAYAQDKAGCKDHPLFNRMPGYSIVDCYDSDFDQAHFAYGDKGSKSEAVEGAVSWVRYRAGEKAASDLAISRNYQNAIKAAGGQVIGEYNGGGTIGRFQGGRVGGGYVASMRMTKNSKDVWVAVGSGTGSGYPAYEVLIAEREAMKQDIVANDWFDKLSKVGFVAIYINFATGSAVIQPASNGDLDQMAQMLKSNAGLKVEVGGHTDNVGNAASNQTLSEARAKSVMAALVQRGIAATRLTAKGYGQTVPIADNRLEEGRALNRRVELAKK